MYLDHQKYIKCTVVHTRGLWFPLAAAVHLVEGFTRPAGLVKQLRVRTLHQVVAEHGGHLRAVEILATVGRVRHDGARVGKTHLVDVT